MHNSVMQKFKMDRGAHTGLVIVAILFIFALAGPIFAGEPDTFSESILSGPDSNHLLGTNDLGQDIFSRLIYGLRTSFIISIGAGVIATAISTIIGVFSGYIGGVFDMIVMRVVDALLVLPVILILILVSAFIKPGIAGIIILISLFHWQGGARIIRGQTLVLKQKTHIYAARTAGSKSPYIIMRHIIPDLGNIIAVSFIYNARSAVFLEAGMAFIGISSSQSISLGTIINNAFRFYYLPVWIWWLLPSGILLSMILMSLTFLGNLMEKVIDPRLQNA
jgi:peptide/nickel transport system permease protein